MLKDLVISGIEEHEVDTNSKTIAWYVFFKNQDIMFAIYEESYQWLWWSTETNDWIYHNVHGPAKVWYNKTRDWYDEYFLLGKSVTKEEWQRYRIEEGYVDKDDNQALAEIV